MNSVLKPQDNSPPVSLRVDVQRDTKAIVFCNLQLLQQLVFFGLLCSCLSAFSHSNPAEGSGHWCGDICCKSIIMSLECKSSRNRLVCNCSFTKTHALLRSGPCTMDGELLRKKRPPWISSTWSTTDRRNKIRDSNSFMSPHGGNSFHFKHVGAVGICFAPSDFNNPVIVHLTAVCGRFFQS